MTCCAAQGSSKGDPAALLVLCDVQIRRGKAERVKEALRGTWSDEHIFALSQALQSWDHYQRLIVECDFRIESVLPPHDPTEPALPKTVKRGGVNAPEIGMLREILSQMCGGRDLTRLPAQTPYSALQIIGETGTDLSKWPTEMHFTAWTGLAPGNNDSGKRERPYQAQAQSRRPAVLHDGHVLVRSKNIALGAFYRGPEPVGPLVLEGAMYICRPWTSCSEAEPDDGDGRSEQMAAGKPVDAQDRLAAACPSGTHLIADHLQQPEIHAPATAAQPPSHGPGAFGYRARRGGIVGG